MYHTKYSFFAKKCFFIPSGAVTKAVAREMARAVVGGILVRTTSNCQEIFNRMSFIPKT